ncbi:ABC-type transport auxiliary lipoprotein family protein [Rhizobium sp. L1K21]|nr:ABC-type transport auxiliary lipoprotein family protein [Rhizobium sp. L1K21]MCO6186214.1 ABC-type transport auxiliary lipoprotein family protein [Rhizobium sp. L1K21]
MRFRFSHKRVWLNTVALAFVAVGAFGCASSAPKDTYGLSLGDVPQQGRMAQGRQLLITEPTAVKTFDSENIVIQVSRQEYQYLGESQWSDRLPKVVQLKLAQAFEASGRVGGAGLPGDGLAIDYQIQTTIHAFQIDATSKAAIVEIAVRVLNDRSGTVRARNVFRAVVPASGSSNQAYVKALDAAFSKVSSEMVNWVLKYI